MQDKVHISCGGIVYRKNASGVEVLLLHRFKSNIWPYDSWHLPKGTKDREESDEETAKREIFEETGYVVKVLQEVGWLDSTYEKEGKVFNKKTHYFFCEPVERENDLVTEHDELSWVPIKQAINLVSTFPIYEKEEDILTKAMQILQ